MEVDLETLILLVEGRPVIWDKTTDDFKDRIKTRNAWEEIFVVLIPNYSTMSGSEKNEKG